MYANTVSDTPTHFLRAVEIIDYARNSFSIPSENWPYPTRARFGMPGDKYYAEVWVDGMDWQPSYWLIESYNYLNPSCIPFVVFEDHKDREKFNDFDFYGMLKAAMRYRRDLLWIQKGEKEYHDERVWPYFKRISPISVKEQTPCLMKFSFDHASQDNVEFFMNKKCVPPEKIL